MGRELGSDAAARVVGGIGGAMAAVKKATKQMPEGYEAREVVLPERYWQAFERQATRADMTVSKWLERMLRIFAR